MGEIKMAKKLGGLNRTQPARVLCAVFCLGVLWGWIPHSSFVTTASPGPETTLVSDEEQAELVLGFNRWAARLRTVRAGGKARVGGEHKKTRAFQFSLVMARPGVARIQGRWGSLATLFDLSGDTAGWTLYLPQERVVVRGKETGTQASLLLPPLEILSILLPAGIPPRDLETRGAATREDGHIRLVVPPGKGNAGSAFHRVLWLDKDEKLRRLEVREKSQLEVPILIAEYLTYEGKGEEAFPVEVAVDMVAAGQWARFSFETVKINGAVSPELFTVNVPVGTRELDPEDLNPDFLPEAEEEP